jgi:hypothetical protein
LTPLKGGSSGNTSEDGSLTSHSVSLISTLSGGSNHQSVVRRRLQSELERRSVHCNVELIQSFQAVQHV